MTSARPDVQPLDVSGAIYAIAGVFLAGLHMALWYAAPEMMASPLWTGSSIPWSVFLGVLALAVPVLLAWLCVRNDERDATNETYEVAGH